MRPAYIVAAMCSLQFLYAASAGADTVTLATVQVHEPGAYKVWQEGAQLADPATGTGPTSYWTSIPPSHDTGLIDFYYLSADATKANAVQYGRIDFTVQTNGIVQMLTTVRFGGGGNSSGDWLHEVSYQSDLETAGWNLVSSGVVSEFGYGLAGTNGGLLDWLLFERQSVAGESFSIRTEKYQAPLILKGSLSAVPTPAAVTGGLALMALNLVRRRRT